MNKIGLTDVKQALKDSRFRYTLPAEFKDDLEKFLQNPGCACNMPFYRRILSDAQEQLKSYFPGREVANEIEKLVENNWRVINCSIHELENKLRELPKGRKQIEVARFQDQVTVIVNQLDIF